jgi:hypothetical protein
VFNYGFTAIKEIIAEYVSSTQIKCRPLDFEYETYVNVQVKAIEGSIYTMGYGSISIYLYEMPTVKKIHPLYSTYDQQIDVSVTISSLPYIHNVYCKFGTQSASLVTIYRTGKQIICKAPIVTSTNTNEIVKIYVSVDNLHWYESEQSFTFVSTPTFTGVDNSKMPLFGKSYIKIIGTNFFNTGNYMV